MPFPKDTGGPIVKTGPTEGQVRSQKSTIDGVHNEAMRTNQGIRKTKLGA